jgi:hypothetical protein
MGPKVHLWIVLIAVKDDYKENYLLWCHDMKNNTLTWNSLIEEFSAIAAREKVQLNLGSIQLGSKITPTHLSNTSKSNNSKKKRCNNVTKMFMRIILNVIFIENVDLVMFVEFVSLRKLQIIGLVKRKLFRRNRINIQLLYLFTRIQVLEPHQQEHHQISTKETFSLDSTSLHLILKEENQRSRIFTRAKCQSNNL